MAKKIEKVVKPLTTEQKMQSALEHYISFKKHKAAADNLNDFRTGFLSNFGVNVIFLQHFGSKKTL